MTAISVSSDWQLRETGRLEPEVCYWIFEHMGLEDVWYVLTSDYVLPAQRYALAVGLPKGSVEYDWTCDHQTGQVLVMYVPRSDAA